MHPQLAVPDEVLTLLQANAPVAVGISGGKDSIACGLATAEYLASINHTGPKILVHSDLGETEWADSLPSCRRLEAYLYARYNEYGDWNVDPVTQRGTWVPPWMLHVVKRAAGGMMERWEGRWVANVKRYEELSCVKLILPWSTASMRFCTAELKRDIICSHLRQTFGKQPVISVTGIRGDESPARAKKGPLGKEGKLPAGSVVWNPIFHWNKEQVFARIADSPVTLHEAYTRFGSSRVSCVLCILGKTSDFQAALRDARNHDIYHRMCKLELESAFAFKSSDWIADLMPDLYRTQLIIAKMTMEKRVAIEKRIPKELEYEKGWPTRMITYNEAALIASVREGMWLLYPHFKMRCLTPESVMGRYAELLEKKTTKEA